LASSSLLSYFSIIQSIVFMQLCMHAVLFDTWSMQHLVNNAVACQEAMHVPASAQHASDILNAKHRSVVPALSATSRWCFYRNDYCMIVSAQS
jgi:hypothetical protein